MICKRDLAVLAAVFGLAACSPSESETPAPDIVGSEPFARLISDAQRAAGERDLPLAGRLLDEAMALEPENPALWVEIARLRYRGGDHYEAVSAADRAIAFGPQHGGALLLKAQLVRDAHGLAASVPWYEAASLAEPDNPEVWLDYAATLGDLGRNRAMLDALAKLADVAPQAPRANYLTAVLAARAGNAVLARSLLERSGMLSREVPAALLLDALISIEQGNFSSAAERLEQLIQRQPDNARARELLARSLLMAGRDAEVVARFGRQRDPVDTSPYLAMLVGRAHERLGERDKAAPWLARALQEQGAVRRQVLPNRTGLAPPTAVARNLAQAGNWAAAASHVAALRQRFPGSADIAVLSGDVALGRGDAATALAFYADASKVRRSWPLARKAIAAYRMIGDEDAADALIMRHLAGDPNNIDAALMLAERSIAWDDWGRAALLLDHVAALGGANDLTYRALRMQIAAQGEG